MSFKFNFNSATSGKGVATPPSSSAAVASSSSSAWSAFTASRKPCVVCPVPDALLQDDGAFQVHGNVIDTCVGWVRVHEPQLQLLPASGTAAAAAAHSAAAAATPSVGDAALRAADVVDIQRGIYEGGLKLWECAIDLVRHVSPPSGAVAAALAAPDGGARVLELGAGHALPSVALLLQQPPLNVRVTVQDYNAEVLYAVSMPNVFANGGAAALRRCDFLAGSWHALAEADAPLATTPYDVIVGSELLYHVEEYASLVRLCQRLLRVGGVAVLANKTLYFGCAGGGSCAAFAAAVRTLAPTALHVETVARYDDAVSNIREILHITRLQ